MKKIILALGILVLAAFGLAAYRWHFAAQRLQAAARGGQYRALGVKLEVAPARDGVRGKFRLRPYVDIPQVVLDLTAWGLPGPMPLGAARLSTGLWQSGGLLLVLEPGELNREGVKTRRLSFELGLPDLILAVRADRFEYGHEPGGAHEWVELQQPWLQLGAGGDALPARLHFRLEKFRYARQSGPEVQEDLQLGPVEVGYTSEPKGADRAWTSFFRGQGGAFRFPLRQGEIGAWSVEKRGTFADLPWARWQALYVELKDGPSPPAVESLPAGESRPTSESRPTAALSPDHLAWLGYGGALQKVASFLQEWHPQLESLEFRWAGMKLSQSGQAPFLAVDPMELRLEYREAASGLQSEVRGGLKKIHFQLENRRFDLEDLSLQYRSERLGLSYRQWLERLLDYYVAAFSFSAHPNAALPSVAWLYRPYLAQLPDTVAGEFAIRSLAWDFPQSRSEHRGLRLSTEIKADGWTYRLTDDFDWLSVGEPFGSVQRGKLDFDFGFRLPWGDLLRAARAVPQAGQGSPPLAAALSGKTGALHWKWRVDLGPELFVFRLDLAMEAAFDKLAAAAPNLFDPAALRDRGEEVAKNLLRVFLDSGSLDLQLEIERLSKLQAAMDRIHSGASLGLALVGAYVTVDAKADTMKSRLTVQNREILLNGRRNTAIEALVPQ